MPYNQCLFTNTIQANEDLVDLIWQERSELSHEEVYLYDTKYSLIVGTPGVRIFIN